MRHIGIDFGTGNTVIAIWNETLGRAGYQLRRGTGGSGRHELMPAGWAPTSGSCPHCGGSWRMSLG